MRDFKINREKKTFVFDDGEELPIPADKVKQVLRSKHAKKFKESEKAYHKKTFEEKSWLPGFQSFETARESAEKSFLGDIPSQITDYARSAVKGISKGEGQEEMGYVDRLLESFYASQEARKEALGEQQEKHPTASMIGKGVGMAGELLALRRLPGVAAMPIMGAGHSETSFLEPAQKAKEVGVDAVSGLLMDRFFRSIGNVAQQRGARRTAQEGIQAAEAANVGELQRVQGLNAAEQARVAQETAAREGVLAQRPILQEAENQNFFLKAAQNVGKALTGIGRQPVNAAAMGVEEFVNTAINQTSHAASKEAGFVTKFLNTIFKGDKEGKLTADSIKKGFKALDEMIAKQGGPTKDILISYKNFAQKRLPENLSGAFAFSKWVPRILTNATKNLEAHFGKIFKISPILNEEITQKLGADFTKKMSSSFEKAAKDVIQKYEGNFVGGISGGTLEKEISDAIRATPEYQKLLNKIGTVKFTGKSAKAASGIDPQLIKQSIPGYVEVEQAISGLPDAIGQRFSSTVSELLPEISRDVKSIHGSAQRNLSNVPPSPTLIPEPPPVAPANIAQPNLQTPPTIPQPQGLMGRLAHWLENMREQPLNQTIGQVKNVGGLGILGKLAGLPVAAIGAAAGAGYGALRGITSPGVGGQIAREGLEAGARAIYTANQMAKRYPSYKNGVIENPEERRSLTKEIEDDENMSLSDKALMQSKVNRGKPLQSRLK